MTQSIHNESNRLFQNTGLIASDDGLPAPIPDSYLLDAISQQLLIGAYDDHGMLGFALCSVERPDLFLEQISVHPAAGRRGIGGMLLTATKARATQRGLFGVTLSTFRDVPWNAPFYAKHGFTEIPQNGLAMWQRDIARTQSLTMDLASRCFMHCPVERQSALGLAA